MLTEHDAGNTKRLAVNTVRTDPLSILFSLSGNKLPSQRRVLDNKFPGKIQVCRRLTETVERLREFADVDHCPRAATEH